MTDIIEHQRPLGPLAAKCSHPLVVDTFGGMFRSQLRHLSCLVCLSRWWESDGSVIRPTDAIGMVSRLATGARPTGWAAAEGEWRRLAEEGLAPAS
jgi:hypothetical protein